MFRAVFRDRIGAAIEVVQDGGDLRGELGPSGYVCLRCGSRLIRNPRTRGLCSSFFHCLCLLLPFFYVANYESLTDCWHFLFLARISRQTGISCMSYCTV